MDPNPRIMRKRLPSPNPPPRRTPAFPAAKRFGSAAAVSVTKAVAALMVALPLVFLLSLFFRRHPNSDLTSGFADARVIVNRADHSVPLEEVLHGFQRNDTMPGSESVTVEPSKNAGGDKLLGGLLAAGFDEASCFSRYQSYLYRKDRLRKPSPYLTSKLRGYEELHKRCGPNTEPYKKAAELLRTDRNVDSMDCKYVVWVSYSGLGNRILSIAATFLYALLTDRVMLVDQGKDMKDLFCEPFPETSWLLPLDFPLTKQFDGFTQANPRCYGKMLKDKAINYSAESVPSYVYLHVAHDYDSEDKLFFCDDDQSLLSKVPWLVMRTDNYFVPSLFLIDAYEQELGRMFPEKGTVFHHLGRYLFHPTNVVWGLITRYYKSYLAKSDESIGIQVRVFDPRPGPFKHVMDQIQACTLNQKLLPHVDKKANKDFTFASSEASKSTAVLVTSLKLDYSDDLRNMYWEHPTVTGGVVGVYQPSHEEVQQTEKQMHNRKAWAEMYLLSLTDNLVTSAWSTFGYVAQGLGGLRSYILVKTENDTVPDPPCRLAMSMEPCFHAPPLYDCKEKRGTDTGALVPHVKHCEDVSWGVKVIDDGHDDL